MQESTWEMLRNGAIRDHAVQIVPLPQPDRILIVCPCPLTHPVRPIRLNRANEQGVR